MGDDFIPPAASTTKKTPTLKSKTVTIDPDVAATSKKRVRKPAVQPRLRGPRFGLADWQRLVRCSKDLAQRKGMPLRQNIPWEEIRIHNKPHDCWMVLRGIVYNISPYLPYHPGGMEIFTSANVLGNDGTKLFDKYHKWISIEGLIGTLAIGTAAENAAVASENETETTQADSRGESANALRNFLRF